MGDSVFTTSISLLERLRSPGDQVAWAQFAAIYTPLLFYWAKRHGLQDSDAADLVQDVMATLVRTLPEFQYEQAKSFRAWLRTVTQNKWRERSRRLALPIEASANITDLIAEETREFWDKDYQTLLVARALEVMRAEFEQNTWQACWAVVVEQRSVAEVAQELGMTNGAVYVAKSRVLKRLREELAELWDEP